MNEQPPKPQVPEQKTEQRERSKRNLLDDYEGTIAAIAEIEGIGWERDFGPSADEGTNNTVKEAMRVLEQIRKSDSDSNPVGAAVIYGAGGGHRYRLLTNGDVVFMKFYSTDFPDRQLGMTPAAKAKQLGFIVE